MLRLKTLSGSRWSGPTDATLTLNFAATCADIVASFFADATNTKSSLCIDLHTSQPVWSKWHGDSLHHEADSLHNLRAHDLPILRCIGGAVHRVHNLPEKAQLLRQLHTDAHHIGVEICANQVDVNDKLTSASGRPSEKKLEGLKRRSRGKQLRRVVWLDILGHAPQRVRPIRLLHSHQSHSKYLVSAVSRRLCWHLVIDTQLLRVHYIALICIADFLSVLPS